MSTTRKVSPDQLGDAVVKIIKEYTDDVIKAMPNIVKEVSKNTVKALKKSAGAQIGGEKYNKSFRYKDLTVISTKPKNVIYSTEYRLTHLLEHGHIIKNQYGLPQGVERRTKERLHWGPSEEAAVKEFEEKIKKKIKEG